MARAATKTVQPAGARQESEAAEASAPATPALEQAIVSEVPVPANGHEQAKKSPPIVEEQAPDPVISDRLYLDMNRLSVADYEMLLEQFPLGGQWKPADARYYVLKALGLASEAAEDASKISMVEYIQAYHRFWVMLNWVASGKKLPSA